MMYGNWGALAGWSTLGFLTWLILVVDLALLGVWLWKQIHK